MKKHGYATYQYSSHQPQIINKVWYRELISRYPDIVTKGYDEWSTYFNYISAEHRDQFRPCPYVTLSWPNIGGEDKGVIQPDYLFENFYGDNYIENRLFSEFDEHFRNAAQVLEDSRGKKLTALKYKALNADIKQFTDNYDNSYEKRFREYPTFSMYFSGARDKLPEIGIPACITLSRTVANKVKISAARERWCAANILTAYCELRVIDENYNVYSTVKVELQPRLNYSYCNITIPEHAPFDRELLLKINAGLRSSGCYIDTVIPINIV